MSNPWKKLKLQRQRGAFVGQLRTEIFQPDGCHHVSPHGATAPPVKVIDDERRALIDAAMKESMMQEQHDLETRMERRRRERQELLDLRAEIERLRAEVERLLRDRAA